MPLTNEQIEIMRLNLLDESKIKPSNGRILSECEIMNMTQEELKDFLGEDVYNCRIRF